VLQAPLDAADLARIAMAGDFVIVVVNASGAESKSYEFVEKRQ
jgi:hypothetical protein